MRRHIVKLPGVVLAGALLTVSIGDADAQGIPARSEHAKACAFLPVADLEAHFGTKATNVGGMDLSTRATCGASFPDPLHAATLESHPSSAADLAMTAAQRLDFLKQAMGGELQETRDFGSVGCFRAIVKLAKPVHETTCFLAKAPYLRLSVHSVDAAQANYDVVKSLLEKAAALRK